MAAIAVAVVFIPSALAVHDLGFQLDGDVSTHAYTVPPAPPGSPAIYDWGANTAGDTSTQADPNTNGLFTVTDTGVPATGTEAVTNNSALIGDGKPFAAASFVRDFQSGSSCTLSSLSTTFCTSDTSTYATGSKDTLGIGNGGWQCNVDHNVNSKIDIMNAYSASFIGGGDNGTDHNIYFGLEKNKNNGTNDVGVWLLQGTASCSTASGHVNFTGAHQNKDVLVVSEFSNGGGVSSISAFQWAAAATGPLSGDGGCIDSNDNPDPKTGGCNLLPIAVSNSDCKINGGNDALCATTNANCTSTALACGKDWNKTVATPWLTSDATKGVGRNQIVSPDFFEGGIDLTKAFQGAGETAPSCFNTVVPDTRSSATVTATLFDFVAEQLGECHSTTVTTPVDAATAGTAGETSPASTIPADPNDAAVAVKDKTVVTVTGVSPFAGSVSWHICGPTATSSTQLCDGTTGNVGLDLGSQSITTSGTYYSPTATVTSAGRYCFRAEFTSTTTGVPGSSDSRATECFTVAPVQPTLTTDATDGPVAFGQSISDTVALSGTAHKPGSGGPTGSNGSINPTTFGGDATGDITVVAFGPNSCSTTAFTSTAISASGDGNYGGDGTAFEFTPSSPGQYVFVAAYAGDSPNTLNIPASACSGAPASEKVTVQQIATDIKTKQSWFPNDTATVCSGTCTLNVSTLALGGTLDFYLYTNATCSAGATNENLLYSERITLTGGNATEEKSTKNYPGGSGTPVPTTATPAGTGGSFVAKQIATGYGDAAGSSTGSYSWLVKYTPPSTDHTGSTSACETFSTTYTNDPGH